MLGGTQFERPVCAYDVRKLDDYNWSQWTFTDGTRVIVNPTQTTQLLGVTLPVVVNPHLVARAPYHPVNDFSAVGLICTSPPMTGDAYCVSEVGTPLVNP